MIGASTWQTPDGVEERVGAKLDKRGRLLVFGKQSFPNGHIRKEYLWQRFPERIHHFANYAAAHLAETGRLPAEYWETVERIDPDNAWYHYLDATE